MTPSRPRIALISAVTSAFAPIHDAFQSGFPEAELWNLLDDRLLDDAADRGGLTAELTARMESLIDHAVDGGADAVLLTCSLYGPVAHARSGRSGVPVQGPDDALFEAVRGSSASRAGLVSSGASPLEDSTARLRAVVGQDVEVVPILTERAAFGSSDGVIDAVTAALRPAPEVDVLVLGQYSLTSAAPMLREVLGIPVLTGPELAVRSVRDALDAQVSS